MSRRSSDQLEEPWHANGPSSRGVKRPSSGDDNRAARVASAPAWGGSATSDVTSASAGFTCAGPFQQDPFICPPARRSSPVGFVMRPGPDSEYDPKVRDGQWLLGYAVGFLKVGSKSFHRSALVSSDRDTVHLITCIVWFPSGAVFRVVD